MLATVGDPSTNSTRSLSPASTPSRDLWEEARQRLSESDREIIREYVPATSTSAIANMAPDALVEAARAKQKLCEDKRWSFNFRGRNVQPRDIVDRVVLWLDKFKTVADVAVNASPVYAGIPWAGVRFLLLVTVLEQQQMGCLLLGLDRVLYLLARCRVYQSLYPPHVDLAVAGQNFESALISLYVLILQFLAKAIRTYARNTMSRAFNAFSMSDDIMDFEATCREREERIEIEAQNCERSYNKAFREEFSRLKVLLSDLSSLKDLKDPICRIDSGVANIWEILNEAKRARILSWVSRIPYEDHHRVAIKGRTEGTGEWFLKHRHYLLWQLSDESMILWLHGIPGAGKTKLISRAIDQFETRPDDCGLAYFYCSRNENSRRDPDNILQSFVKQLSISSNENVIQGALVQIYNEKERTGFASVKLSPEECERLLLELIQGYSQTTLIVDGLDECEEKPRRDLIKLFNRLTSQSKHLKILISSRPDGDIKRQLQQRTNIGVQATDNANDISKFVSERIDQNKEDRPTPISEYLQTQIVETLLVKSCGMFQWTALQIAEVLELELERDIQERLGRLPDSLKEAYDEIYAKIKKAKGSKPRIAARAFQWVMCARARLQADVLVAAVSQDPEDDATGATNMGIDFVLDACCNLLVVDPATRLCRLSHLSVHEYLEDHHWNANYGNGTLAKVCLSLLNNPDNWNRGRVGEYAESTHPLTKLLHYVRRFWPTHVKNHGDTDIDVRLSALLQKFLGSMNESGPAYKSWHETYLDHRSSWFGISPPRSICELNPPSSSLIAISFFGFNNVLSEWWKAGCINLGQQNSQGHSVLIVTILRQHLSVTERLLRVGADVNMQWIHRYSSALHAAVIEGNENIVQLLLDSGAHVNAQIGYYNNALQEASARGREELVLMLVRNNADVNATGGTFGSALNAASAMGHKNVAQILLDNDADVNTPNGQYDNALSTSILEDSKINHSPLSWAAAKGHKNVVNLLLDNKADCGFKDAIGRTPLSWAAANGHEGVVKLLLDNKADYGFKDATGRTPLSWAASNGNMRVVILLLQVDGVSSQIPLRWATMNGHSAVIKLLLHANAPTGLEDKKNSYQDSVNFQANASTSLEDKKNSYQGWVNFQTLGHTDEVWDLKFSNDGTKLATVSRDCELRIYDTVNFTLQHICTHHKEPVSFVVWSPDDTKLITCSQAFKAVIWETQSWQCTLEIDDQGPVTCAAWAPDGLSFVTGSLELESGLCQWSISGNLLYSWPGTYRTRDCSISPDGKYLITSSLDKDVYVYNFLTKVEEYSVKFGFEIIAIGILRESKCLLMDTEHGIRLLDIKTMRTLREYQGIKRGDYIHCSAVGGVSEKLIAGGSQDSCIHIWNKDSGTKTDILIAHEKGCVNTIDWNPRDPNIFASAGDDKQVRIWLMNQSQFLPD